MIIARVPVGEIVMTLKGEDWKELAERIRRLQENPPKPATSVVTRSGERIDINSEEFFRLI